MGTPRCGVPDVLDEQLLDDQEILDVGGREEEENGTTSYFPTRRKRYALQGSRWRTKSLTYKVTKQQITSVQSERLQPQPCMWLFSSLESWQGYKIQSRFGVHTQLTKVANGLQPSQKPPLKSHTEDFKIARVALESHLAADHSLSRYTIFPSFWATWILFTSDWQICFRNIPVPAWQSGGMIDIMFCMRESSIKVESNWGGK